MSGKPKFTTGPDTRILATGGASLNKAILQVMSDVFSAPVYVIDVPNSAALGGCYRAKHSITRQTFDEVVKGHPEPVCIAKPSPEASKIYSALRDRFKRLEKQIVTGFE